MAYRKRQAYIYMPDRIYDAIALRAKESGHSISEIGLLLFENWLLTAPPNGPPVTPIAGGPKTDPLTSDPGTKVRKEFVGLRFAHDIEDGEES